MPLHTHIHHNNNTQILIWQTTESLQQLTQEIQLSNTSQTRLNNMKSEMHQRAFLSVRKLLSLVGYTDFDLDYDPSGKPRLNPNCYGNQPVYLSISHSHHFSALLISNQAVGIDIEKISERIEKIAPKFAHETETKTEQKTTSSERLKKLTVVWGAKEAVFKIKNKPGISFKNHIRLAPFELNNKKTTAVLMREQAQYFDVFFEEIANYMLVYAFQTA